MTETHTFARDLVVRAGDMLRGRHLNIGEIMQKGDDPRDEVTAADLEINTFLTNEIGAMFPSHGIGSEEAADRRGDGIHTWHIDPIDGTSNFARAIPHFAVCVSLMVNDCPKTAAIYNPMTGELFSFDHKDGPYVGITPIHTSSVRDIAKAQVFYHIGRRETLWDWGIATMRSLLSVTKKIKDPGASSLDLAFLAAGRADVVIYGTMTTLDISGAIGMIRSAGGEVYSLLSGDPVLFSSDPQSVIAVADPILKEQLVPSLHLDLLLS